jgi:hypothetical protein
MGNIRSELHSAWIKHDTYSATLHGKTPITKKLVAIHQCQRPWHVLIKFLSVRVQHNC